MFDEKFIHSFCEIIKEYGECVCKEPAKLAGLLKDYCGEYKKEIFMIVAAAKVNVPVDIYESNVSVEILKHRLVSKIVDNLGFAKEDAEVLVNLWLLALDKITFAEYEDSLIYTDTAEKVEHAEKAEKVEHDVVDVKLRVESLNPLGQTEKLVKIREYVEFGRYFGEPILWKCVNKDGAGVMLVSEYVLCQKAFDAAESGMADKGITDVQKYGSNVWSRSNIREWLNSPLQTVCFNSQAPVKSALYKGNNAYSNEAGFISNFTQAEREKIMEVSYDGVTDKVFLLSENEVNSYVGYRNSKRKRKITNIGKERGEYEFDSNENYSAYWTRTSSTSFVSSSVQCVIRSGEVLACYAINGGIGVLPALNLQSDIFVSGKGTMDEPWKMK